MILEPKKLNLTLFSLFPHLFAIKWWDQMPWYSLFECWVLSQIFNCPLSLSSRGFLVQLSLFAISLVSISITVQPSQSCPTLCNPMDCSIQGFPVYYQLPELTQTHIHRVNDTIQPSHPLSYPSPPAYNFSQHQALFKWVSSLHQVAKVLEFQLQHQSF